MVWSYCKTYSVLWFLFIRSFGFGLMTPSHIFPKVNYWTFFYKFHCYYWFRFEAYWGELGEHRLNMLTWSKSWRKVVSIDWFLTSFMPFCKEEYTSDRAKFLPYPFPPPLFGSTQTILLYTQMQCSFVTRTHITIETTWNNFEMLCIFDAD